MLIRHATGGCGFEQIPIDQIKFGSKDQRSNEPGPGIDIVDTPRPPDVIMYIQGRYTEAGMKATVKKWGNSAAVRIPASVMQAMHLDLDEVVEVREEKGRIVIEPVRQKTYVLDDLLKGITAKNRHEAVDFGPHQGKEVW
jgi:antitoxin MazE